MNNNITPVTTSSVGLMSTIVYIFIVAAIIFFLLTYITQSHIRDDFANTTEKEPIILRVASDYRTLRFISADSYDKHIYTYFKRHIYPCTQITTDSYIQSLAQLQSNTADIAFINEYHLLQHTIKTTAYPLTLPMALGIGYYEYVFIISSNESKTTLADISNTDKWGVTKDDYPFLTAITKSSNLPPVVPILYKSNTELFTAFTSSAITVMFIVTHQKNEELITLSKSYPLTFITFDSTVTSKLIETSRPISVDLHSFYRQIGNNKKQSAAYRTLALRTVLTVNASVPNSAVSYLIQNYIAELTNMRDTLNLQLYNKKLNNFMAHDFKYSELISMHPSIPLHPAAIAIYKLEQLIYHSNDTIQLQLQPQLQSTLTC
jgi:hypothetical protein